MSMVFDASQLALSLFQQNSSLALFLNMYHWRHPLHMILIFEALSICGPDRRWFYDKIIDFLASVSFLSFANIISDLGGLGRCSTLILRATPTSAGSSSASALFFAALGFDGCVVVGAVSGACFVWDHVIFKVWVCNILEDMNKNAMTTASSPQLSEAGLSGQLG